MSPLLDISTLPRSAPGNEYECNRTDTLAQLATLTTHDPVHIRLFKPKHIPDTKARALGILYPRKGRLTQVNGTYEYTTNGGKTYTDGLAYLHELNRQGYGVYFVPNPGGDKDSQITKAQCLWYECDDLPLDAQQQLLDDIEQALGCPSTLVIRTRKSLHCYFVLTASITPQQFRSYQKRLIRKQGADKANCNPARCMRLAGYNHVAWLDDELVTTPVTIVSQHDGHHSIDSFEAVLPQAPTPTAKRKRTTTGNVAIATDATSARDARNFAHLLPGYENRGDWTVFQCPVHTQDGQAHSTDSIHIYNPTGGVVAHCGCELRKVIDTALKLAQCEGYKYEAKLWIDSQEAIEIMERHVHHSSDRITTLLRSPLVGIRSNKGTGKTEFCKHIVAQVRAESGAPCVVLTHRIQLHKALSNRLALRAYGDESLCLDSLHPRSAKQFRAQNYPGALVVIDECCQVRDHLLAGTTDIHRHRQTVASELVQLLRNASHVVILDADLDQATMNFFRDLMGLDIKQTTVLHNRAYADTYDYTVHRRQSLVIDQAIEDVTNGGRIFFCCTAQQPTSRYSAQSLASHFSEQFPDKKFIAIDSITTHDSNHPAYDCADHINELVAKYDGVFATPSIETGVSIDVDCFTGVYGIFNGCTQANAARQALARVRQPVPRHIYVAARGLNPQAGGALTMEEVWENNSTACQRALGQLAQMGGLAAQLDCVDDDGIGSLFIDEWARRIVCSNIERLDYAHTLCDGLDAEGHRCTTMVRRITPAREQELLEEIDLTCDQLVDAQCQAIVDALPISADTAQAISHKPERTRAESNSLRKYTLTKRYLAPITHEVAKLDFDDEWYGHLRLQYLMGLGKDYLSRHVHHSTHQLGTSAFSFDVVDSCSVELRAQLLDELGVSQLLNPDEVFTQHHPVVLDIAEVVWNQQSYIQHIMGFDSLPASKPVALVNKLLRTMGLTLTRQGKDVWSNGGAVAAYRFEPPTDGREEVFKRWLTRDSLECATNESAASPSDTHTTAQILVQTPYKRDEMSEQTICTRDSDSDVTGFWSGLPTSWTPLTPLEIVDDSTAYPSDEQTICTRSCDGTRFVRSELPPGWVPTEPLLPLEHVDGLF